MSDSAAFLFPASAGALEEALIQNWRPTEFTESTDVEPIGNTIDRSKREAEELLEDLIFPWNSVRFMGNPIPSKVEMMKATSFIDLLVAQRDHRFGVVAHGFEEIA